MNTHAPARPPRRDTLNTRRRLVDAAETLFAERGVDNVTLLEVARAAGQKNRNAAQYHFGDKAGLINAVLDKHSNLISQRRRPMVEALLATPAPTLGELVEAYVRPVAEHVANDGNGLAFLLVNCQIRTSGAFAHLGAGRVDRYPEVRQLTRLIERKMTVHSRAQRQAKMLLIQTMLFHGLAGFHVAGNAGSGKTFVRTLCAGVEAVLAAP